MLIDLRTSTFQPGNFKAFLAAYDARGFALQRKLQHGPFAVMTSDSGVGFRMYRLFAYKDAAHQYECRRAAEGDAQWNAFLEETLPMQISEESVMLTPTPFSNLKDYAQAAPGAKFDGGTPDTIFELRAYLCIAGKMQTALGLLKDEGVPITHKYIDRPIGYFTSTTGVNNTIYMLYAYNSPSSRDARRAELRTDAAFKELGPRFMANFIQTSGEVIGPIDYSPLR